MSRNIKVKTQTKYSTKTSLMGKIANKIGVNNRFSKFGDDIWINDNDYIISPVDAKLVAMGNIKEDGKIISKGNKEISLSSLIGDNAKLFNDGVYFNLYLSPKSKHYWRIPYDSKLLSVNLNQGKAKIPVFIGLEKIFKRRDFFRRAVKKNASIGMIFNTSKIKFAMIPIGSLNVNGIHIVNNGNETYKKGDIGGYFTVGSSMLLCFPKDSIETLIKIGDKVKIGENIIRINMNFRYE